MLQGRDSQGLDTASDREGDLGVEEGRIPEAKRSEFPPMKVTRKEVRLELGQTAETRVPLGTGAVDSEATPVIAEVRLRVLGLENPIEAN